MEYNKDLEAFISQALLEVERDLSLPNNSLVDNTPSPNINREVRLKKMEVRLNQNFMSSVPDKLIQHSRELKLRKRVADQQEKIALLMNAIDVLLDQQAHQ